MSSNIRINRLCQLCGKEFEARTTVTKTCSDNCAKRLYKVRKRSDKIDQSNRMTQALKLKPIEELKAKEFLTVKDLSTLLNCSIRTAYYLISNGNIKAVNIAKRKTLVKRSEIDKLFI
jgi:excisionase family DNA binding protein